MSCLSCVHFDNSPQSVEASLPWLKTLSSGFASVRDQDGLCALHERYVSARASCPAFRQIPIPERAA
jgi:hypothetical protein